MKVFLIVLSIYRLIIGLTSFFFVVNLCIFFTLMQYLYLPYLYRMNCPHLKHVKLNKTNEQLKILLINCYVINTFIDYFYKLSQTKRKHIESWDFNKLGTQGSLSIQLCLILCLLTYFLPPRQFSHPTPFSPLFFHVLYFLGRSQQQELLIFREYGQQLFFVVVNRLSILQGADGYNTIQYNIIQFKVVSYQLNLQCYCRQTQVACVFCVCVCV
eukprot:TRINITY_DN8227_c0_g3_i1.p1 TRINITY_DN8227_c0_g3~~TRINITY_DN8227_c0_g3_i1.p1  ORF type:complete len:214 (+),score=-7.49 TRINITY_DN8227_c0_g3_i1:527-1168(+)